MGHSLILTSPSASYCKWFLHVTVRFLKYPFFINLLQQLHNIPKIPITIKFVPSVVCGEKEFFSLPSKANRSYLFLFLSSSVNLCTVFFPPWQKLMKKTRNFWDRCGAFGNTLCILYLYNIFQFMNNRKPLICGITRLNVKW